MTTVRLYIAPTFRDGAVARLIDPDGSRDPKRHTVLFKTLPPDFTLAHEIVTSVSEADFVLAPQSFKKLGEAERAYLTEQAAFARAAGKKLLVFLSGDYCHRLHIDVPDTIVFKASEYRGDKTENEVIFSPFVEDLGTMYGAMIRGKGEKPIVSFCGYAGFPSVRQRVKYLVHNALIDLKVLLTGNVRAAVFKRGIYFRRKGIHFLSRYSRLDTRFTIRSSFSGNTNTIDQDPRTLRAEYVASMQETDFVLCPKGDANFSSRFFECLSLGRIPVLIDTEMYLPLEQYMDYDRFMVRVPYTEIDKTGEYIMKWWESHTNEEYREAQEAARSAYKDYLRYDAYFNRALPLLKDKGIGAVVP